MSSKNKYVLIGMGAFGQEIAYTLKEYKVDMILMDKNEDVIQQLRNDGFQHVVQINSTHSDVLKKFVNAEDIVILAMGESFEDNIVTVGILMRIGVNKIYTRATKIIHEEILHQMKNTEILFPEREEGKRFALKLLYKELHLIQELASGIFICENPVPPKFYGQNIIELQIRNKYGINVIGLKEKNFDKKNIENERMIVSDFEKIALTSNHILVFIAKENNIRIFVQV